MAATGKSKTCVWRWQERFMNAGVDGLLREKTRPPGKRPVAADRTREVVRLTLAPPPHEATHWTLRAVGLAASTIQGIWQAHGLAPHRRRQFKLSKDPAFGHCCLWRNETLDPGTGDGQEGALGGEVSAIALPSAEEGRTAFQAEIDPRRADSSAICTARLQP